FIFISVDKNSVRFMLTQKLLKLGVTFIDVGLGVNMHGDRLIGTLRITTGTCEKNDHLENRIGAEELNENDYATNIQIADLNCLNAMMAVIKWKKMCDFYQDLKQEHNTLYFINTNRLMNEDNGA
ncbi:MAG TPA: ThiF family adenylyltransferase, partial [Chitinophagales bacterium]|nr:ThiF family adenylyltransferase [Chitinophagales bacterium]